MASLHRLRLILCSAPIFLLTLITYSASAHATSGISKAYPALFVFGDSASDPGNKAIEINNSLYITLHYPYGETFPGRPFGRYSDGHTVVDFLAEYLELPLLNPYLDSGADFRSGVNYAVGGATALNVSALMSFGISPETSLSLDAQLAFHLTYKASVESSNGSLAGSPTTVAFMEGLYFMGIGGNDFILALVAKYSFSFLKSIFVPLLVQKIRNGVETLLDNGAKNFLFVSPYAIGCCPAVLAQFDGVKDSDGCLEEINSAAYSYGERLYEEVANLRDSYPEASFLVMDAYGAYKHIFDEMESFGFTNAFEACCGAGENYSHNYNQLEVCNINSALVCTNPSAYVSWDGIHFTDSFNFQMFNQTLVNGSYLVTSYNLM